VLNIDFVKMNTTVCLLVGLRPFRERIQSWK